MRQGRFLRVVDVLQECPGSRDTTRQMCTTEAVEISCCELVAQQSHRTVEFEMPGWSACHTYGIGKRIAEAMIFIDDQFGGAEAFQFALHGVDIVDFRHPETARREVQPGDADALVCGENRCHHVVPMR